ncbi:3'-5' exonuclease [Fulvimarina sp. MAC3]|uniref:3'-5' exonuclease n=1 Tax=Fulvimarina sp. MAC3 TaxID=3148887 RepID=UPI0031FE0F99
MPTLLADTFQSALTKLTNDEQKQVKICVFDLQSNPSHPGLKFHRIDKSKDPNFWSVRVGRDIRVIVHKTGDTTALVYVDHHDDAYKWAERRKLERHETTGALQIVEVRERVVEIEQQVAPDLFADSEAGSASRFEPEPKSTRSKRSAEPIKIFSGLAERDLLSVGVPRDWLSDVLGADEDGFFRLASHLPQEAGEALLEYAATGTLTPSPPPQEDAVAHPDTLRRFRVMEGVEELKAALEAPFERWAVFLHPMQNALVQRGYTGPARVTGSAGTGKTVVALHRVVALAKADPAARIALTTFSRPLAETLKAKLELLSEHHLGLDARVTTASFLDLARETLTLKTGREPKLVSDVDLRAIAERALSQHADAGFALPFVLSEWRNVVDAWRIETLEAYRNVPRMGRKSRLGGKQRDALWPVFEAIRAGLRRIGRVTPAGLFAEATSVLEAGAKPYDYIVVDEAQDLGVAELRFLAATASIRPDALFFAGDLGQRIFQQPFSWKGLGVDVRGRSATLKVNYRTSHQIRRMADLLMPSELTDVDGVLSDRQGTVSVFEGPEPVIVLADDEDDERDRVAAVLKAAIAAGLEAREIGVFVRSEAQLDRARALAQAAGLPIAPEADAATVGTMHLAKGLEFRAVAVVALDEDALPTPEALQDVADGFDIDEAMAGERQLLYVAATRARDRLILAGVAPGSPFIEDLRVE